MSSRPITKHEIITAAASLCEGYLDKPALGRRMIYLCSAGILTPTAPNQAGAPVRFGYQEALLAVVLLSAFEGVLLSDRFCAVMAERFSLPAYLGRYLVCCPSRAVALAAEPHELTGFVSGLTGATVVDLEKVVKLCADKWAERVSA